MHAARGGRGVLGRTVTVRMHAQACAHPVQRFVVAMCANASWAMLDVAAARPVWRVQDGELSAYTCGALHPDGNFFAAGGAAGGLRLFDVRAAPLMSISAEQGVQGAVRSIAFNENGYWAALACDEGVQVRPVHAPACMCPRAPPPQPLPRPCRSGTCAR
jgi:WD40 repeat protein